MRETLYIRLRSGALDEEVEFALAAEPLNHALSVHRQPLRRVLDLADGRPIVLLCPTSEVRLAAVDVPAKQPAKVLQAAPYLLEDQLAEDVDTLHFAIAPRQADGQYPVAVVAKARMNQWLAPLQAHGLQASAIYPDVLALPWNPEEPRWSAVAEPEQITARTGAYSGFCAAPEDLSLYLELLDSERAQPLRLLLPGDAAQDFTRLDWPLELLPGYRSALEALVRNLNPAIAINLLQGEYSPKRDYERLWMPWRLPAALAAALTLVSCVNFGIETWQLRHETEALQQANIDQFRQLFPAEQRIVNLEVQLDQQMANLNSAGNAGGLFFLLQTLADALADNSGLQVTAMQFRNGELFLSMTGKELRVLESFREWFSQRSDIVLTVESADSGSKGVSIRARLSPA